MISRYSTYSVVNVIRNCLGQSRVIFVLAILPPPFAHSGIVRATNLRKPLNESRAQCHSADPAYRSHRACCGSPMSPPRASAPRVVAKENTHVPSSFIGRCLHTSLRSHAHCQFRYPRPPFGPAVAPTTASVAKTNFAATPRRATKGCRSNAAPAAPPT